MLVDVVAPLLAKGVIVRRPRTVEFAQRLDTDRRAVNRMTRLGDRYGEGPLLLRLPARDVALVLSPGDVERVLVTEAERFTPANREKRAALAHFQPRGVLISRGAEREVRRRFNEAVLDTDRPVHGLGADLVDRARQEAEVILDEAGRAGELAWTTFSAGWWRMVRRVVLGDHARGDHAVTDTLSRLRRRANWAYLMPQNRSLRDKLHRRLADHLSRAEPGSLAARIDSLAGGAEAAPTDQVAHWLFAFDAAGMASFRALALLDSHPAYARRVRDELPLLRATVLESLRLWPTTPAVLRDTTEETVWGGRALPSGTAIAIFAPFFHRDRRRLPYADSFAPEIWLDGRADGSWPLIPFSLGPAGCPGRNLVLLLTSSLLATLLERHGFAQRQSKRLSESEALPATLSPFGLRFGLTGVGVPAAN